LSTICEMFKYVMTCGMFSCWPRTMFDVLILIPVAIKRLRTQYNFALESPPLDMVVREIRVILVEAHGSPDLALAAQEDNSTDLTKKRECRHHSFFQYSTAADDLALALIYVQSLTQQDLQKLVAVGAHAVESDAQEPVDDMPVVLGVSRECEVCDPEPATWTQPMSSCSEEESVESISILSGGNSGWNTKIQDDDPEPQSEPAAPDNLNFELWAQQLVKVKKCHPDIARQLMQLVADISGAEDPQAELSELHRCGLQLRIGSHWETDFVVAGPSSLNKHRELQNGLRQEFLEPEVSNHQPDENLIRNLKKDIEQLEEKVHILTCQNEDLQRCNEELQSVVPMPALRTKPFFSYQACAGPAERQGAHILEHEKQTTQIGDPKLKADSCGRQWCNRHC